MLKEFLALNDEDALIDFSMAVLDPVATLNDLDSLKELTVLNDLASFKELIALVEVDKLVDFTADALCKFSVLKVWADPLQKGDSCHGLQAII